LSEKTRQLRPRMISEVVDVDEKLTIRLPESLCKAFEITPRTKLLLTANPAVGEIVMNVAALPRALMAEARMVIDNQPGAMAKITGKIAQDNVNIVMFLLPASTKNTISGTMLFDLSRSSKTLKELETTLSKLDVVKNVTTKLF
jgi:acetolactate synthase-1/3 small subunit